MINKQKIIEEVLGTDTFEFMKSQEFAPIDRVNFVKLKISLAIDKAEQDFEKEHELKNKELEPVKYVIFKDRIFLEPFKCLCCLKDTDIKQFCWGRTCAYCDAGRCQRKMTYEKGHGLCSKLFNEYDEKKDPFLLLGIPINLLCQATAKEIIDELEDVNKTNYDESLSVSKQNWQYLKKKFLGEEK